MQSFINCCINYSDSYLYVFLFMFMYMVFMCTVRYMATGVSCVWSPFDAYSDNIQR